jgi:hypothetical protein
VIVLVPLYKDGFSSISSYVNDLAAAIYTACTAVPGGFDEQRRGE